MAEKQLARILEEVHAKREAGFNCAEGAFWGISQCLELDLPVSCVSGFGGGIAGRGSVCGALCGAIAATGVFVGRTEPTDNEGKVECTALSKAITQRFQDEMGTLLCREILGYMPGSKSKQNEGPRNINPKCVRAVAAAIEFAWAEIEKARQIYIVD